MPVERPSDVYREQLSSLYHGLALWKPNPEGLYRDDHHDHVSIGDVGYISEGAFIRMFNVTLPWDDQLNRTSGIPDRYDFLNLDNFTIRREALDKVEYYSRHVLREENTNNTLAASPYQAEGVTYRCRGPGALLSLPHGGHREDAIQTKVFKKYIRDHVFSWFNWSRDKGLPVERMEDLVLVYGCTLVTSWAVAAFDDYVADAQISLTSKALNNGGTSFYWTNIRGVVEYHGSQVDPNGSHTGKNHCVFIKCFRAKHILSWTRHIRVAAEPIPDDTDTDSSQGEEIQVTELADVSNYCDPLIGILDYIVEKRLEGDIGTDEDDMAITHHDDLRLVKDVEVLTADAVEQFLRVNKMPLLITDGVMMLQHTLIDSLTQQWHEGSDNSYGISTTVNPSIDAFDFWPCPPMPGYLPLDVPLPRSDTEKASRGKRHAQIDQALRQPKQEGSVGYARSHSRTIVSSGSNRRQSGGRQLGPAPLTPPRPQLTASNWRDLAYWACRPSDHLGRESSASPSTSCTTSNPYDQSLPPLPRHLSHLPAPSAPLNRLNSSTCALNRLLVHRPTGVPLLSWDLCTSIHSILFSTPGSGTGPKISALPPAVHMSSSDYAQPATWPPCGAFQIGAIGGQAFWRWPVDVRNRVGVRCGDVFAALVANLHQFVRPLELADMPSERVALAAAASSARVRARLPPSTDAATAAAAAMQDGIRRVDFLLGHTRFHGLEPGPSSGEWTMYVDNYVDMS